MSWLISVVMVVFVLLVLLLNWSYSPSSGQEEDDE